MDFFSILQTVLGVLLREFTIEVLARTLVWLLVDLVHRTFNS